MPYIYVVARMEGHVSAPLRMSTIGSGIWELGPQGWGGLGGAAAQVEEVCHPGAGAGFWELKASLYLRLLCFVPQFEDVSS